MNTEPLLSSSLGDIANRHRRMLLASSSIGLFIGYTKTVPTQVTALGISLDSAEQDTFLTSIALLILYFLIAFIVHASADFIKWRILYQEYLEDWARKVIKWENAGAEDDRDRPEYAHIRRVSWPYRATKPAGFLLASFEYIVPFVISIASIVYLLGVVCDS